MAASVAVVPSPGSTSNHHHPHDATIDFFSRLKNTRWLRGCRQNSSAIISESLQLITPYCDNKLHRDHLSARRLRSARWTWTSYIDTPSGDLLVRLVLITVPANLTRSHTGKIKFRLRAPPGPSLCLYRGWSFFKYSIGPAEDSH